MEGKKEGEKEGEKKGRKLMQSNKEQVIFRTLLSEIKNKVLLFVLRQHLSHRV